MDFYYKKAIVTGGAGFIGSHLVEELVNMGVETLSLDNYVAGKHENLKHLSDKSNFREIECDITDYDELKRYFDGVDIVFHQAASKKTICLNDPRRDLEINAKGTFNLLELSRDFGVRKFVHASTGSVYGEALYMPQDEQHPLNPTSYYGVSKLAGERYVNVFHHLYDLNTTILRYFHVYGSRQESSDVGGVVSIFCRRLLSGREITIFGDGTQQRSFTWVKDIVKANLLSAIRPDTKGKVYNCASGIKVTIRELAEMIADILDIEDARMKHGPWTPGDIKVFDIDNTRLRNDLQMEFMTDFRTGLKQTIDWARTYFSR